MYSLLGQIGFHIKSVSNLQQGSYRSWKTWKVMEFYNFIFLAWKVMVMEFLCGSWKVTENDVDCTKLVTGHLATRKFRRQQTHHHSAHVLVVSWVVLWWRDSLVAK